MIVSVTNNKGGCGKTTTAVNLGAALTILGMDVLAVDLDGQANLTISLGVEAEKGKTTYDALTQKSYPYIKPTRVIQKRGNLGVLDVLPACSDLSASDVELSNETDRLTRLKGFLWMYRNSYDFILIDTPPALGLLTISALVAADATIITLQPHFLAVQGLVRLRDTIQLIDAKQPYCVLFTQYDGRKGLHRLTAEQVRAAGIPTFKGVIRSNVALGEAPAVGADIFTYAPNSHGAQDYLYFGAEFVQWANVEHTPHGYK